MAVGERSVAGEGELTSCCTVIALVYGTADRCGKTGRTDPVEDYLDHSTLSAPIIAGFVEGRGRQALGGLFACGGTAVEMEGGGAHAPPLFDRHGCIGGASLRIVIGSTAVGSCVGEGTSMLTPSITKLTVPSRSSQCSGAPYRLALRLRERRTLPGDEDVLDRCCTAAS